MATYAIGDVQGCFATLERLLTQIQFDAAHDTLWFTGDLVNRGSQSLDTLRFIKQLGQKHRIVLGNHDLHLLAVAAGAHPGWKEDTFKDVLDARDRDNLLDWLRTQPLFHYDARQGYAMVHAGIAASWDLQQATALSAEVSDIVQGPHATDFFTHMYGNQPDHWDNALTGWDRLRCITNYFTRARFCYSDGHLELKSKGTLASHPPELIPWYDVPQRKTADINIVFGHWAALGGVSNSPKAHALDTGCFWGFDLTAMRLEDRKRFSVPHSK